MNTVSKHYISRAKERTGVKCRCTNERIAGLALRKGKRANEFTHREQEYLYSREDRGCLAVAYNGFCYIFSQDLCCITMYALPDWFGRRIHYEGKEKIRDYKRYSKYNQTYDDRALAC